MPKLTIDDNEIEVEEGLTVMQACKQIGIEIPHFCFHKKLKIAGNCRMCLVEMERAPKPIASCATTVFDGMKIKTNTPKIKKARSGVMEFLLANHPLDCPICDQGGECDLQDQAFKYGKGSSRYSDNKRAVRDKNLGPLVKTQMTRCIHCTRCVRFATEIAGVQELGAINRGGSMEITSYLEKALTSELSGNIIDLCPVGALTSKPYAFTARSWELEKTESIDVMDALGSNIRIDSRGMEVMRILPKLNEEINEEWISDKARFVVDGLKVQRLDTPYIRKNAKLSATSWDQALSLIEKNISSIKNTEIASISGSTTSVESMFLVKQLFKKLGSNKIDSNQFNYKFDRSSRANYLFNTTIEKSAESDVCLLIGANIRASAPVLNARIGQAVRSNKMYIANIGKASDQTYHIDELGNDLSLLESILAGKGDFAKRLKAAKKPMIIIGSDALSRNDGHAILALAHAIVKKYKIVTKDWNGFNILHDHASAVGGLDIGFIYGKSGQGSADILKQSRNGKVKVLYLLGADDFDTNLIGDDCFVIYQGHHGDKSAKRADVILPEAAYTEQDAIFVNMEGRPQYARGAISPPGMAKETIEIINLLADRLDLELSLNNIQLNNLDNIRKSLAQEYKIFANMDNIISNESDKFTEFKFDIKLLKKPLQSIIKNYYMTDPISRASVTMAKCTKEINSLRKVCKLTNSDNLSSATNFNNIDKLQKEAT